MKIAMVAEPAVSIPPLAYGGTERVIYYLIKGLVQRGHDITLLATGDSQVPCHLIPICRRQIGFGRNVQERAKVLNQLKRITSHTRHLLEKIAPEVDIIHSHGFDLKKFQNYPNLTTLHQAFIFSRLRYFEKRQGLFYVTVSENQQGGFPDLQYVGTCYNGLDPDEFPFVEKPQNYLCFLGRFDPDKRPHLAIELALKLNRPIKLAGKLDHYGQEYFTTLIKPHLDNPLVEYLGELKSAEKIELLSHACANLHPIGFREPFGLTVLEAAYCGTPTMAITKGSMPELIEHGRTGLVVEDFVEGYHLIDKLLSMDRKYISERARNLFSYQTMAHQYELAYEKIVRIFNRRRKLSRKALDEILSTRTTLKGAWRS